MGKLEETLETLKRAAGHYRKALVAFSGGKDSLTVLDMAKRHFKEVECFYLYFVPGLSFIEERLNWASKTFDVRIRQYQGPGFYNYLRIGAYTYEYYKNELYEPISLDDIYAVIVKDTGIPLIITGMKKSDFLFRRLNLGRNQKNVETLHPIHTWQRFDVLAYLKSRNIPVPAGSNQLTNAVDLQVPNILWLHDNHPEDFKKVLEYFPFAEAVIWRRRFYKLGGANGNAQLQKPEIQTNIRPKGWLAAGQKG